MVVEAGGRGADWGSAGLGASVSALSLRFGERLAPDPLKL